MVARQLLASVELTKFQGLYTKQNPETLEVSQLRECKNADFFREYGSLSKMRGNRLILNDVYTESGNAKGIYWGGFYKAQSLTGAIDRQVLIGAGTTICKVNTNGTTTALQTGEPDALARTSDQLDRFLFITSQDPFNIGIRGTPMKYNGTRIVRWGVVAPGTQETEIEDFDDDSIFTASNCTISESSLPAFKGNSIAMVKGTASTSAYIEDLNRVVFEINNEIEDRARVNVFIPRGDYRKLATSGRALSVYIGSAADLSTNYYRFDFQIGRLFEGWNTLIMDFSTSPSGNNGTTVGVPVDNVLASIRFEVITNSASDTLTIYWDNFIAYDQGAVIPTFAGAAGTIFEASATSEWIYKVSFVDDAGFESNAGPESPVADNTVGSTNYARIELAEVPISTNAAVVARKLYRTTAGGSEFLFLDTINDNVTTTYTDTTDDTALGSATPMEAGNEIFDHSPPPNAGITLIWKRTAFMAGDPLNPTTLYFSRFDFPEAFPVNNTIEFDTRITGMFKTFIGMVIATEDAYWRILNDNPDYTVDKVVNGFGCVGARAIGAGREMGWIIDRDGMRLYDLREAIKVSEVIRNRVDGFYKGDLEDTHSAHARKDNAIIWLTKDSTGVYSDIYMYQYMIDEVRQGWFSQVVLNPTTQSLLHIWEIEDDNGDFKTYAGMSGGQVCEIMAEDSHDWLTETGQRRALTMQMKTAFMRLGVGEMALQAQGAMGRVTPRQLELRIKEVNGAAQEWALLVETSDSASENATIRGSKSVTCNFSAGQSIMRVALQDLTPGEYVRVTLTNEELGKDLQIMGIKIYYAVRPGQFGIEAGQVGSGGQN